MSTLKADISLSMIAKFGAVVLFTPAFIPVALALLVVGVWLGQMYIKAQLPVKREMSAAKAPVLGILGGAIAGLRKCKVYSPGLPAPELSLFKHPFALTARSARSKKRYRFALIATYVLQETSTI